MENIVFSGSKAGCARVEVVGEPTPELLRAIETNPDIFHVSASKV
jgi:hypothetical protein